MKNLLLLFLTFVTITFFFACKNDKEEAEQLYKEGVDCLVKENKYNEAADKFLHSLSLQNEKKATQLLISTYQHLSTVYWEQDYTDKALFYAQKGLHCTEQFKNDSLQAQLLNRVASCYYMTSGKEDSAYIYYNRLLELSILRGDTVMASNACNNIGSVLLTIGGDVDEALAMFDKSQEHSLHRQRDYFKYHYNRSRCFQSQGMWAECADEIRLSMQYIDSADIEALEKNYRRLYVCKKHLEQYEEACVCADSSYFLADSLFRFKQREELKHITEQYQQEKYEAELQLQQSHWVLVVVTIVLVALMVIVAVMYSNKKRMLRLQRRMDTLKVQISKEKEQQNLLSDQSEGGESVEEENTKSDKLSELYTQQILLARDIYRSRPACNKLRQLRYHVDNGYLSDDERLPIIDSITEVFIDSIHNLRSTFPELTADECLYAILVFVGCENSVISILTKTSEATLRKRRSRFKQKVNEKAFALLIG